MGSTLEVCLLPAPNHRSCPTTSTFSWQVEHKVPHPRDSLALPVGPYVSASHHLPEDSDFSWTIDWLGRLSKGFQHQSWCWGGIFWTSNFFLLSHSTELLGKWRSQLVKLHFLSETKSKY